jgi:RNA polymerase sigma-70 factor, ECF subfamily
MPGQDTFVDLRRRALLDEQRPRLLGLAYRLLGSVTEARLALDQATRSGSSVDPTTLVTQAAMTRLREVRPRRQAYAGRWLPEPVTESTLSLPMLLALECLSPLERCAYVLRVVDGLPYADVATALDRSEPAARQLVRRARKRLGDSAGRPSVDANAVHRFADACRSGRLAPLVAVLAGQVVVLDGASSPRPLRGEQAAAVLLTTLRRLPRGTLLVEEPVNGEPSVVGRAGGRPVCALALQPVADRLGVVLVVTNPVRLSGLTTATAEEAPGRRMP